MRWYDFVIAIALLMVWQLVLITLAVAFAMWATGEQFCIVKGACM